MTLSSGRRSGIIVTMMRITVFSYDVSVDTKTTNDMSRQNARVLLYFVCFSQLDTPSTPGVFVFTVKWGQADADLSLFV